MQRMIEASLEAEQRWIQISHELKALKITERKLYNQMREMQNDLFRLLGPIDRQVLAGYPGTITKAIVENVGR